MLNYFQTSTSEEALTVRYNVAKEESISFIDDLSLYGRYTTSMLARKWTTASSFSTEGFFKYKVAKELYAFRKKHPELDIEADSENNLIQVVGPNGEVLIEAQYNKNELSEQIDYNIYGQPSIEITHVDDTYYGHTPEDGLKKALEQAENALRHLKPGTQFSNPSNRL